MNRLFVTDFPERPEAQARLKNINPKYSKGPNDSANLPSAGAKNAKSTNATIQPKKELNAQIRSVEPALPCFANGYPSMAVGTDATSPGIFKRTEVIDPPYIAP